MFTELVFKVLFAGRGIQILQAHSSGLRRKANRSLASSPGN